MKQLGFAVIAGATLLAGGATAQTLGIATSNPGSLYHSIGTAIAKAANGQGLNVTIQPATSPNQYLPAVGSGDLDFGIGNLQEFNYALEGKGWFSSPNPNLRIVALLYPLKEAIFVRKDSNIKTVGDLKGKRMTDGFTAQNTIIPQLEAIYATAGLTRNDIVKVQVASVVAGADAFAAGQTDGFIFAHGAAKVREADAAVGGIRALPIPNTPEAKAAIKKHWSTGFLVEMKPGPASPGVLEPGYFIAYPQLIFTNKNVPDATVAKMAKIIYEKQAEMGQVFAPMKSFDPKKDMVGDTAPGQYHPGAIKFYEEVGLWKKKAS
ncbi:MAG TPA: TAXI family TRAP transporter solute-binding subunit [Xanthobacteraceae bacterium]|nr:TAXI family TRAP transporter solute-binding subunit [Xanthobacteraceae bacterium]